MNRRSCLKGLGVFLAGMFLPKKPKHEKPEQVKVPFLPTLEWLQEHNPDIIVFIAEYSTRGYWYGYTFRKHKELPTLNNRTFVYLFWENEKWVVGDSLYRHNDGMVSYKKKIPWPNWLRKF
jgi:hypothetical protein